MSKKNLKKALIPSVIALVLCFAMLLGTTFAWFTDTAETGTSVIKSGTLDIELYAKRPTDNDYAKVTKETKVFNYELWEPGYTDFVNAKVVNEGTLAIKYTLKIVPTGTVSELADVIDVYYAASEVSVTDRASLSNLTKIGTLAQVLAGTVTIDDTLNTTDNKEDFATIALVMQTTAGNDYQGKSVGDGFTIQIVATQAAVEEDAFGSDYDASATFPG